MTQQNTGSPEHRRFFALIPGGGKSQRMGRPKLSLTLGDRTILEHVISGFRGAGLEDVVLVLSPHSEDLRPSAMKAGATVVVMDQRTLDMRATIQAGLRWLQENRNPSKEDFWFLSPADHPTLSASIVEQLKDAAASHPNFSIFIPTFGDKRGHPALVSCAHIEPILEIPEGQGVNTYLRSRKDVTQEIASETEAILWDLDTPEDYRRLQSIWEGRG